LHCFKKNNNIIYLNFFILIVFLIIGAVLPLKFLYIFFISLLCFLIIYKIDFIKFLRNQKFILLIFFLNLPLLLYFYLEKILFETGTDFVSQIKIITNLSLRTSAAFLAINFYKKINSFSDTLKILLKIKIPLKLILIIIISIKLMIMFKIELNNFLRNFKLKVNDHKLKYFFIMVRKILIHFYTQAEKYSCYLSLKNLNNKPEYLKIIFK